MICQLKEVIETRNNIHTHTFYLLLSSNYISTKSYMSLYFTLLLLGTILYNQFISVKSERVSRMATINKKEHKSPLTTITF